MPLRMWMLDLAREQSPSLDHLRKYLRLTQESGFDALGLYFESRFAHPATPFAHGVGCVTPDDVRALQAEFPSVGIVPFLNLLGHCEQLLYTEEGKRYREELLKGMQACPTNEEFRELCRRKVADTLAVFSSQVIHIGGDETWQLGSCDACRRRLEEGGKARIYGEHFGPLAQQVLDAGRTPAIWGDMFEQHPEALEYIPQGTLIFDWKYFSGCADSTRRFQDAGFEVVGCPALHTYNAAWLHVNKSEENVRQVASDCRDLGAHGVCVTTWECGLLGAYDTLFPAIRASATLCHDPDAPEGAFLRAYLEESERHEEWARLLGVELEECGGVFGFSGHRNKLKCRLLLYSDPFLAWMRHADELMGETGERALGAAARAEAIAPDDATRGVAEFVRLAIEFVRSAELARRAYAAGRVGDCLKRLADCRAVFDPMERIATRTHARIGGSLADIERCRIAREKVETVMRRVKQYGDGSLGYLPAFEVLTHPRFVPHDQACWWLINSWGAE